MNLVVWILVGLIINLMLITQEEMTQKGSAGSLAAVVLIRSISGGIISNYLFNGPLGSLDPLTFISLGVVPLLFLLLGRMFYRQLT